MKQVKCFYKRLLTVVLCLALVVTSINLPTMTVQAAQEQISADVATPFGLVAGYDAATKKITMSWGNDAENIAKGYLYCISIVGKDTVEQYNVSYDELEFAAYGYEYEGTGEGWEIGKTYTVQLQSKFEGNYSSVASADVYIPTGEELPGEPYGLVLGEVTSETIELRWGGASFNPTGWEIYIDDVLAAEVASSEPNYKLANNYTAGTYTVKIYAVNGNGKSATPAVTTINLTEENAGISGDSPASEEAIAELQTLIAEAVAIKDAGQNKYSDASWQVFVDAITAAEAVLEEETPTINGVKNALATLKDAKNGLVEAVEETEGNLIQNGTFASGTLDNWGKAESNCAVTVSPYKVVFDITGDGWDWQNWLIQDNVVLDMASTYEIKFDVISSIDRYISAGFNPTRLEPAALKAGEKTTVSYTISNSGGGTFAIYVGSNIENKIEQKLGAHQVIISNVRITKTEGEAGEGGNQGGNEEGGNQGGGAEEDETTQATDEDIDALQELIAVVKDVHDAGNKDNVYTEASWTTYDAAVVAANDIVEKYEATETVTVSDVNTAIENLKYAYIGLVLVEDTENNIIKDGTFQNGIVGVDGATAATGAVWEQFAGTNAVVKPNCVVVDVPAGGTTDYQRMLTQTGVTLESGSKYLVKLDVISSIDRSVFVGFDGPYVNFGAKEVKASVEGVTKTTVEYVIDGGYDNRKFAIFLGANAQDGSYNQNLEAHQVIISNVSITKTDADRATTLELVKLENAIADVEDKTRPEDCADETWDNFTTAIEDAQAVLDKANSEGVTSEEVNDAVSALNFAKAAVDGMVEVPGNLIRDGLFVAGLQEWKVWKENCDVTVNPYSIQFDIKNDGVDYGKGLYQTGVTLDAGAKYLVQFDVESSIDRELFAGFDAVGPRCYGWKAVKADEKTTVEYEVDGGVANGTFAIFLGSNYNNAADPNYGKTQTLGAHTVSISNVRITKMPVDLGDKDTENDTYPAPMTTSDLKSLSEEYVSSDLSVIKNGTFRNGLANWETYQVDWMEQWFPVGFDKTTDGMLVSIGKTGDELPAEDNPGSGNNAWDIQLNQNINLKANLQYTLSFKVTSNKTRSINVLVKNPLDDNNTWLKSIGVEEGETREVVLNLPVYTVDANKLFSFQMGRVNEFGVENNTLLIEDVKIEVHGYQDLAERVVDGNFDDGLGDFEFDGKGIATCDTTDKSVKIDVAGTLARGAEDITLTKSDIELLAGQTYRFSFVAGDVNEEEITVNVKGDDDSVKKTQNYILGNDATEYSFTYAPATDETVSLEFVVSNAKNTVCLDTIRCDINGYTEAAGIDTSAHDITALNKYEAPIISEANAAVAYMGNDIVLTYENNEAFAKAIDSITVDGVEVFDSCTITDGAITLDKSLFTVTGDSKIFEIEIGAYWYEPVKVLQTVYKEAKWTETWLEEFDGTALDTTKWSYQNGTGAEYGVAGWGNEEQQYYTNENITVGNGALTIVAEKDNSKGTKYTSGRIWTMNDDQKTAKFSQKYGRMEAKIKVPAGEGYEGIWPAFWMLPVDTSIYGGWPLSGEIDIMEIRGRLPDEVDGTIHYGKDWPNNESTGAKYKFSTSEYNQDSDVNDYHIYALEWEPGEIRWYVDGELYSTKNNWYSQSSQNPTEYAYPAPYDQQFYIILNMAVGGTFDGKREPNADNLPAEMVVDYVRVYESVDGYDENVSRPETEKDSSVDITTVKSNIIDPKFENVTVITSDLQKQDATGWNFVTLPTFGGAATLTTVEEGEDTLAKINITNGGSQAYAIQLLQNLSLVKGYCYKLSFDAKADSARNLAVKFGDVGDSGWGTYATYEANLGTDLTHYEYSFQMLADTDLTSRVEFNWGTNTTTGYIGNITLEIVDSVTIDYDATKPALFDDNQIYNGAFNLGGVDRLAYWHVSEDGDGAVERATDTTNAFKTTKGTLYQKGIQLLQSDSYKLTFDTEAAEQADNKITVTVKNADGSEVYATETLTIVAGQSQQEMTFTMDEDVTDLNAVVEFVFEDSASVVKISDIWLVKTSYNNVDWDNLNSYPLTNGDFELGDKNWSEYGGAKFTVVEDPTDNSNHVAKVNGAKGGDAWANMLIYDGLELEGGYTYEFAFDAWADSAQEILITMEDGSYTSYFTVSDVAIGTGRQSYNYTFKLDTNQNVALKFQFGNGNSDYTAYVDNVKLNMKGAPTAPGSVSASAINYAGKDLTLTISGTDEWKNALGVYVNSEVIDEELYNVEADTLTIDKSLFTQEGTYKIALKATGYAGANVTVYLYPANGNLVVNGGFQNTVDPMSSWGSYIESGSGKVEVFDGRLKVDYYYGWKQGELYVPWNISFNQENITVEEGKTYEISFLADSEIERPIMVSTDQGAGEVHQYITLEEGEHVYKVTFTSTSDVLKKLLFQVGTVGSAEQYNAPAAFDAHTMYFDSISIRELEEGETTVPVYTEDLTNMIAAVEDMEQGNYTDDSWANLQTVLKTVKEATEAIDENTTQPEVDRIRDTLQEAIDKLETKADMTQLTAVIAEAETLVQSDYTEETWTVLADTLVAAMELVGDPNVSEQSVVNNMVARLNAAMNQLVRIDRSALNAAVAEAEGMTQGDYTKVSWEAFQSVLTEVKEEMATATTQEDVDALATRLQTAKEALVEYSVEELSTLVESARTYEETDYTAETWANFAPVLEAAEAILGDEENRDQTKVDNMVGALNAAMAQLERAVQVDRTELTTTIEDAEGYLTKTDKYTADSLAALEAAIKAAKAVAADTETTQEVIDAAKAAVEKAVQELEEIKTDDKGTIEGDDDNKGTIEGDDDDKGTIEGDDDNKGTIEGDDDNKGTIEGDDDNKGTIEGDDDNKGTIEGDDDNKGTIEGDDDKGTGDKDDENIKSGIHALAIEDQVYTGSAIKPVIAVYDGADLLTLGKDYTVSYKNNKKVSTGVTEIKKMPTVIVKGKGNYKGKYSFTFNIVERDITKDGETLYGVLKNGKTLVNVKPVVTTVINGKTKKLGSKDYEVKLGYTVGAEGKTGDTYAITVTGKGSYKGTIVYPVTFVADKNMLMKNAKIKIDSISYDDYVANKRPVVTAKAGNTELTADKDYTIVWPTTVNAGKVTVMVAGNETTMFGSKAATFKVTGENIKKVAVASVADDMKEIAYNGDAHYPAPVVTLKADNNKVLVEGKDYLVTGYAKNTKPGTATITIVGIGKYEGKMTAKFKIMKATIDDKAVAFADGITTVDYTKAGAKADVVVTVAGKVLVNGVDYKVAYKKNKAVGTAEATVTGKGGYAGKVTKTYTIEAADFGQTVVSAQAITTGTALKKIKTTVTDGGKKLDKKEYTLSYFVNGEEKVLTDTVAKGDVVTVVAKPASANYVAESDSADVFEVSDTSIAKAKVKIASQTYTGEEIELEAKDFTTIKVGKDTLTLDEDFEIVGYSNNVVKGSKATVTIQGIGEYCGTKTIKFNITERDVPSNWNVENTVDAIQKFLEGLF